MTTEEKKHAMYYDLACLKGQKKHPKMLARFESHLEDYLEALRLELKVAREAIGEHAGDAKDLHELRESAGRLIVRNTHLEEALRKEQEGSAEIFMKQRVEITRLQDCSVERWQQLQSKQELILSQRQAIKTLRYALASVQKSQEKPRFWGFLSRKKNEAKPLPAKTKSMEVGHE